MEVRQHVEVSFGLSRIRIMHRNVIFRPSLDHVYWLTQGTSSSTGQCPLELVVWHARSRRSACTGAVHMFFYQVCFCCFRSHVHNPPHLPLRCRPSCRCDWTAGPRYAIVLYALPDDREARSSCPICAYYLLGLRTRVSPRGRQASFSCHVRARAKPPSNELGGFARARTRHTRPSFSLQCGRCPTRLGTKQGQLVVP